MRIVNTLNRLGNEVLNKYPEINWGGCCVYAALVAKELCNQGHDVSGIVASRCANRDSSTPTNIVTARPHVKKNTVRHWQNNGISFSHVGLEIKFKRSKRVFHYDTAGVHLSSDALDNMPIYEGRLAVEELASLARYPKGWNDSFDRQHIPALRRLVKLRLKVD
jgi:hypothetical protein